MQDFIVLGIIPGTTIQLDFNDWLVITGGLIFAYMLISFLHRRSYRISLPSMPSVNTNTSLIGPLDVDAITV